MPTSSAPASPARSSAACSRCCPRSSPPRCWRSASPPPTSQAGTAAVALLSVVILVFQYLVGALLVSQDRADELELRARQLAGFQVALLSALLRTLDLRDRMTARHSAAVARYSREIAAEVGMSAEDQELVHSAGLLHDIGKFVLPDNILKSGRRKLTDEEWEAIKTHPYEGARIVSQIDGYQPIGEIILAHHERIDGTGYPRGLADDEIPELAKILSVADTYDVMTARDTYREPVSSYEAVIEMRRVSGHASSTAATSRPSSRCSTARTSPTATARTPTSRPSWRSTSASTTTSRRPRRSARTWSSAPRPSAPAPRTRNAAREIPPTLGRRRLR